MNPKLIPAATQDQMNYITRINADQQLHIIISFKAHIQEQLLSSAMLLSILRDPVLGCRFIEKNNRTYWQPRQDLTASDLCSLVFTADLQKDLFEFVTMPSDPLIDPLFRARIFRGAANDTLCVKVNHVLADGAGTKEVVYLISDTYSKLAVEPGYTPEKSKFYPRSQAVIFKKVGLANLIKFRPRTFTLPKPLFELPFVHETGAGSAFALRQIKPEIFKAIKEYGKLNQATLNDLILTAYYRSLCLNGNPPLNTPLPVQVSIDLRHFLPAGHTQRICNLSGGLFPAITFTPGETFQETLKKVQEKMAHWKSRQPGLTGAIIMELAMLQGFKKARETIQHMLPAGEKRVSPLLLSNFGLLDKNRLIFAGASIDDAFELGPVMFKHGLMLTASTYNDRLTLASGYCRDYINSAVIEGLLQQVVDELVSLVNETLTVPMRASVFSSN